MTGTGEPSSAQVGSRGLQIPVKSEWGDVLRRCAPTLVVILGALMTCGVLALEYFKPYSSFSLRQILAACGCATIMLSGAAWEVSAGRRALTQTLRFWAIAGFLAILTVALQFFHIENRAFSEFVAPLTLFGFIVNHHLQPSIRKPFFVFLSLAVVVGVFGSASVPAALALILVSLALIGVCHLPIPMWGRLAILAACAAGLAVLRLGWLNQGWAAAVVPIVASIFMFRLAVYLYDISHGKGPKDLWGRLGYFFMFPNMVFPFFPVIDFSTFGRTYYNAEPLSIYQRGASYMLRGLIHLLLYRVAYMYFVLAPDQIHDPASFLQYVVANFALYLRISGLFHLVVGGLVIFGYNLPETHTRFYFANSFIDFWRRINIYWKDFMQKMVFTPSYMQFKKLGASHLLGVSLSILVVFLVTWALHAYQWFWITGTYLFTATDMLFWAILGLLLVGQTLLEARPKPVASASAGVLGARAVLVIRTVCTFLFICLLWSFWTSPTVADWLSMVERSGLAPALSTSGPASVFEWAVTLLSFTVLLGLIAIAMGLTFGLAKASPPHARAAVRKSSKPKPFYRPLAIGSAATFAIIAAQMLAANTMPGAAAREIADSIGTGRLNRIDQTALTRGYYEDLAGEGVNLNGANSELSTLFVARPATNAPPEKDRVDPGVLYRSDYLRYEFAPNSTVYFHGLPPGYPTNRWGMADRDYSLEKPGGTYRIAMLGASRVFGLGVDYTQRFETLLEERLNREQAGDAYTKYEILNFGGNNYSPVQRLISLEEKALRFQPDNLIYVAGLIDTWTVVHAIMVRRGAPMPYPYLDEINQKAGVKGAMSQAEIERRLEPYRLELASGAYRRIAEIARARGAQAIWIHVPDPADRRRDVNALEEAARAAGFVTVRMDDEFDPRRFQQSPTDGHPNPAGNKLIAELIYDRLLGLQEERTIDLGLVRNVR